MEDDVSKNYGVAFKPQFGMLVKIGKRNDYDYSKSSYDGQLPFIPDPFYDNQFNRFRIEGIGSSIPRIDLNDVIRLRSVFFENAVISVHPWCLAQLPVQTTDVLRALSSNLKSIEGLE